MMHVRSEHSDQITDEYGGEFRRIFPWENVVSPPWGGAFMSVAANETSNPHHHDEDETFIFIAGAGIISVDGERRAVGGGDVVYLPRGSHHFVTNTSDRDVLKFLCIWWGGG